MHGDASFRTWVEIDSASLRHNLDVVRHQIGTSPKIISVVKANAYGHGVRHVLPALHDGSDLFAVANLAEALELRELGCKKPIFLLGPSLPAEYPAIAEEGFIPTLSSAEEAETFTKILPQKTKPVHFAVDNGMGRIGSWIDNATEQIARVAKLPGLEIHSISTHLPSADEDVPFTKKQLEEFAKFAQQVRARHPSIAFHALNSAGIQRFPEYALDMVRPGLMLYGVTSISDFHSRLKPALQWKSRVTLVREISAGRGISYGRTHVTKTPILAATLPVGYADGYQRQISGKGARVLLNGKSCPLLGRVTMDQIIIDTIGTHAKVGDIATLIGTDGKETIRAEELADLANTIPWHIFTALGNRVHRLEKDL